MRFGCGLGAGPAEIGGTVVLVVDCYMFEVRCGSSAVLVRF